MFSQLSQSGVQELLKARLDQVEADLRELPVTTRQEALAAVYSRLNGVLSLGNQVSPLKPILREGPAVAGDLDTNFRILNRDAQAIVRQLLNTEETAARLFNLFASTQTFLRQLVRERLYESSQRRYFEAFIHNRSLEKTNATIDFSAGVASLPVVGETRFLPLSAIVGVSSVGEALSSTNLLLDDKAETSFRWNGNRLELVFEFEETRILNRFRMELIGYQGLNVEAFSSSPDGVLREDLLIEQAGASRSVDGSSSKFAGDWIADFDPRHVKQISIVLTDRAGDSEIAIRNVSFSLRQFSTTGRVQTTKIEAPLGSIVFRAEQHTADELTSITHQISTDGIHFSAITSGQQIEVGDQPYWYRGMFERLDSNFEQASSPVSMPGEDPGLSPDYKISSMASVDLGGGVIERTLNFERVIGTVILRESPLEGTFIVYDGIVPLGTTDYQMTGNVLHFPIERQALTMRYQTSAYARAGLSARKEYHSPLLYSVEFERL